MSKSSLALRFLMGIKLGLVLSSYNGSPEAMPPEIRSFYEQLDPEAKRKFQELDPEHKMRAMSIVDHYCKAVHECKGHREQAVAEQYNRQMQERGAFR